MSDAAPRGGSIRGQLLAGFLAVALVPLAVVVQLDLRALESSLTASAFRSLRASAAQTAVQMDAFLGTNLGVVGTEARVPTFAEFLALPAPRRSGEARRQVQRLLESITERDRAYIISSTLLDRGGSAVVDSRGEAPPEDASERDCFQGALETGLAYAGSVEFAGSGEATLCFSAPVVSAAGEPLGVLRLEYGAAVLQRLVARSSGSLGPGSFAILVDENGLWLASGDDAAVTYRLSAPLAPERAAVLARLRRLPAAIAQRPQHALWPAGTLEAAAGPELSLTVPLGARGERSAGALAPVEAKPWRVAAFQPEQSFLEPVRAQRRRTLTFAISLAAAAAALAMAMASRLSAPIARLTSAARRVAAGDLSARAEVRSGGEIGRLAATFEEMTTRIREREAALAAETERLAVTLRSIGDGVITTDVEGRVALVNAAAEQLTGWTQADAEKRPIREVFGLEAGEGQAADDPVLRVIRGEESVALPSHAVLLARDGTRRVIADTAAPIRDGGGHVVGAVRVFRDVTDKEKLAAELVKMEKLESVGLLAAGIAHDLNNILAVIVGNVSAIKVGGAAAPFHEEVDEIEAAAQRATDLSRQLLTFSRGGAPIKQAASIAEIIETTARFALHGSNVRSVFALSPDLAAVEVDPGQMDQVVHNLVLNAIQAMPDGGTLQLEARNVTLGAASPVPLQPGRYVEFTVRDTGAGIAALHLGKIFDPFFTTKPSGSGLGLATVYSIVKRHDGHVTVESTRGRGHHLPRLPGCLRPGCACRDPTPGRAPTPGHALRAGAGARPGGRRRGAAPAHGQAGAETLRLRGGGRVRRRRGAAALRGGAAGGAAVRRGGDGSHHPRRHGREGGHPAPA
jgi:PAS domain S-box-containing protein